LAKAGRDPKSRRADAAPVASPDATTCLSIRLAPSIARASIADIRAINGSGHAIKKPINPY
jgi:hypothetical protein